ncbi:MAG: hypothetical protein JJU02_16645 [Cryomorphaceae bacterium]|nr:hypothetical protein [Cryomorphaceae bacterium]
MKRFLNLTLATIILFACKKENRDDELHLQQTPYLGDELRIDGFYYQTTNDGEYTQVFFLHRNGVLQGGFSYSGNDWEQKLKSDIESGEYHDLTLRYKTSWGLFEIEDSLILYEKWYSGTPGPRITAAREGKILNDTTFHIQWAFYFDNGQRVNIRERDERYHFREFSPKPDSTNPFIP